MLGWTAKSVNPPQTEQQRAARLAQLSSCQRQRIATETEEQRAARLAQLTSCQQQRLSTETEEQRATRLAERILSEITT